MTTAPVRLDRLQRGIVAWISAALPDATVVWSSSEYPRPDAGPLLVSVELIAGPDDAPLGGASSTPAELPLEATYTLASVGSGAGSSVGLDVSGRSFEYTIQSGDDVTDARDGLLARIGTDPMVSATFTPASTAAIGIEALELGDLYGLAVRQSEPGMASIAVVSSQLCRVSSSDVVSQLRIEAFGTSRYPRTGAHSALARLRAAARLGGAREILDAHGLSLVGPAARVVPLNRLAGPGWESRSAWTVQIAQISLAAEAVGRITSIRGSIEYRGATAAPITEPLVIPET